MKKLSEIHVRDPYVLVHEGKYYLYGTRGRHAWKKGDDRREMGFDVYVSEDLENWSEPIEVFNGEGFWADNNYWAPEVHFFGGAFYLFASFIAEDRQRGTQILRADSPEGPFRPISDGPVTPADWRCLDGTLYVSEEGIPYMVFCHEWTQIENGTVCAVRLTEDLSGAVGEPFLLFSAKESGYSSPVRADGSGYITDGPFLYRMKNGKLLMLWSSCYEGKYIQAVACSDNGEIDGNWTQTPELLMKEDGGHGMVFWGLDGKLYLILHRPNGNPHERPALFVIEETENGLRIVE